MWNLDYTIPTFLILTVILIYYITRPRIKIRMNRTFITLIFVNLATMVSDYIATTMDISHASYSISLLYIANMLFFFFYVLRSYLFYRFTVDALAIHPRICSPVELTGFAVIFVSQLLVLVSPWLHTVFSIDNLGYHSGPAYPMMTVHFLYFVIISILLLLTKGKDLSFFRFTSILAYNMILLLGIFIRLILPHVLLMDLFTLLAIIISFLSFQNPTNYLEERTRFFNQQAFETTVHEMIASHKSYQILGFILKNYTDNRILYGNTQMDSGLNAIAGYLRQNYPKFTYFYLGSGRFILQAPESADLKEVQENLLSRFNRSWNGNNAKLYLQVGFITVNSRQSFDSDEQFLDCLHSTFRQADNITRNNCLVIDEEHKKAREHYLDMKRSVENAIKKSDVLVYLQPIIDASTGKLAGAEALARLKDPKLGIIMPAEFIPLAEENGSILTMGEQIFRKACEFMIYYGKQISLPWINVNLSPIQCLDHNLPEEFYNIIKEYNLTPDQIRLEITEEENIDHNLLQQQIHSMEEKGFSFILDDYGTGYSNIDRIKKLSFHHIKMDKSIVWEYFKKPDDILPLTVQMFRSLGMSVTAEGVETAEMAEELTKMGCTHLQGYYYAKPMPMEQFYETTISKKGEHYETSLYRDR